MKNKKTIVIVLIIVAILVIGVIVFLIVRRRNKKKQEELEAQLAALQAAQSNPAIPPGQKANIGQQIAALLAQLGTLKTDTGGNTEQDTLNWNGGGVGICVNPAILDKSKKLKKGFTSSEVCQLQSLLNKRNANLVVDGVFGKKTEDALLANARVKEITLEAIPKQYYA